MAWISLAGPLAVLLAALWVAGRVREIERSVARVRRHTDELAGLATVSGRSDRPPGDPQ